MLIHNLPQNTRNSCIFFGFYFVLFLHKWTYSKLSAFSEHSAKAKDSQSFECTMISFISNWPISRISTWKAKGNKVFKYLHRQMLIQMKVVTLPKLTAGWQAFIRWCTEVQIWYLWLAIHNVHMLSTTCTVNVMTARKVFYFLIWQVFLLHCYYKTIMAVPWFRQLVAGPLLRTGFQSQGRLCDL